jgi:hypothetical protein
MIATALLALQLALAPTPQAPTLLSVSVLSEAHAACVGRCVRMVAPRTAYPETVGVRCERTCKEVK